MTQWRIVEGTNDEGHPDLCAWDLIYVSEYDVILNPTFFEENKYSRVKFKISNELPTKTPLYHKVATTQEEAS